jgi:hypothetical protein
VKCNEYEFSRGLIRAIESRVVERCAAMLRTEGVMLPIVPGETKHDHIKRYAFAMAKKMESEFGLSEAPAPLSENGCR